MFPYEILVGLRRTMCTCTHGLVGKRESYRKLNTRIENLYHYSKVTSKCNVIPRLNVSNVRKFHTQLLRNCLAHQKDSELKELCYNSEKNLASTDDFQYQNIPVHTDKTKSQSHKISESINKWIFSTEEKIPSRDIEKKFPEPKMYLNNLYGVVTNETKIPHCLTFTYKRVNLNKKVGWSSTYHIKWPENKSFTSEGTSKATTSISAALKCLYWLYLNNRIHNKLPVIYNKTEISTNIHAPEKLQVEQKVLNKIEDFLNSYEQNIMKTVSSTEHEKSSKIQNNKLSLRSWHIISQYAIQKGSRNKELKTRLEEREQRTNQNLPIFQYKSKILEELNKNQALVIKGDTGCGKTTQVPQFIIDDMASKGCGSDCKMIVTQPRRISAISLAQRIAFERNESIGDVVGYQVRLQQALPKQNGAILFCTTGILLQKLQHNLNLEGCSHIIIDEAHERSVGTDMLLVLLKRAMNKNPSLKVIVMSATINADMFQEYLNCNSIEVPGRLFPVKVNFLEDIENLGIVSRKKENIQVEDGEPFVDCEQIFDLIQWICKNKPPGSILCFLPGWHDIVRVQMLLEEYNPKKQVVVPLHSKLSHISQNKIFDKLPEDVRKIILATDIAETGITVPDVVYVVDSACHKEARWNEERGLSSVNTHWVSKANINQRKGRAGRVQEGESFHFITKDQYDYLDAYPVPEVLRVSLEKTALDAKTYSDEKATEFLGSMPQPPRKTAIERAINDLQKLGALDENENLTALGKRIALFTIHPKLSKAMVYASVFQCLKPVTTVAAVLSLESEIFYGVLDNKSRIRNTKSRFHPSSDHLSVAWIHAQWEDEFIRHPINAHHFSKANGLHAERMTILHKVRNINLEHLYQAGMINDISQVSNLDAIENTLAALDEVSRGVLLCGIDQILKHQNFEFKKGRFTRNGSSMITEDGCKAQLSTESVNYKRTYWQSPYLIYYQKTHHTESRLNMIRDSSILSPLTVILFTQGRITGRKFTDENKDEVLLEIEGKKNVRLICDKKTAEIVLRLRDVMWTIARYYVEDLDANKDGLFKNELTAEMDMYKMKMLQVLAAALNAASKTIDVDDSI